MPGLNYSKWDNIDVSDDEDDTHPNVDTPSLFRWRHKARVEREEALRKERFEVDREGDKLRRKEKKLKDKVADGKASATELAKCQKEMSTWLEKEADLAKREKAQAWNVDTLSTEVASKTLINKPRPEYKHYDQMTEEEKNAHFERFHKDDDFKTKIKTFGMTPTPEASQEYLSKNTDVVCDFTASFLTIWCVDLAQEGKHALSDIVAHQTISMQFILELSKHTKRHPADCFPAFYRKRLASDRERKAGSLSEEGKQHHAAFNDELKAFKERVKIRVQQRNEEAAKKKEKEDEREKQKREYFEATGKELADDEEVVVLDKEERLKSSPGGLDPIEVLMSLPDELRECFETQSVDKLQQLINDDFPKYAEPMRKCVLSGLWVPTKDSPLYVFLDPDSGIDPNAPLEVVEDEDEDGVKGTKIITKGVETVSTDDTGDAKPTKAAETAPVESKPAEKAARPVTSLDEVD